MAEDACCGFCSQHRSCDRSPPGLHEMPRSRELRTERQATMDRSTQLPVILIVDDDSDIRALLDLLMHHLAPTYDIITVRDAQSALSHLAHRTVPLLITDYM